jgi:hypothetical protein
VPLKTVIGNLPELKSPGWGIYRKSDFPGSAEETSTMLYFPVDKPSARMEIPFTSITEQETHAWRWPLAASVLFFRGWMRTLVRETQMALSALSSDREEQPVWKLLA